MLKDVMRAAALGVIVAQLVAAGAIAQETKSTSALSPDRVKELYFDAAREGRVDLLEGLVKEGMSVDLRDSRGFTLLILAAYNRQHAALNLLIGHGADPCAVGTKGNRST